MNIITEFRKEVRKCPLAVAILNDSSFRLYRLKRIKNVQLDR